MADGELRFWSQTIRWPFRLLAGFLCIFMLVGAVAFFCLGLPDRNWRLLLWSPIMLLNAGGLFGVARTGRWWVWREPRRG